MKNRVYYVLLFVVCLYTTNISAQDLNIQDLEMKIDALVPASVKDSTPGLVVGVVKNGELIFSKGYGLANLSYGIPNDPKMVYNIGSVSKQFLGYAFAMLHEQGALNIDEPVGKYLEDWPEFKDAVTLRHLLTHTSGYREAYTMSTLAGRLIGVDRLSREECLEVVRKQPELEFTPGSRWTYNSTAWVILAEVLEKVTGEPADIWVENNLLAPLQMKDTRIESYVGEVIPNVAESYSLESGGYTNEKSNRAIFGAAEVYTSINDLVKWINNYRTAELGGKTVNALFLDPFILNDGLDSEYALGIGNASYKGLKRWRHTGGHEAFITQLSYFPDHDLGIMTVSNYGRLGYVDTAKIAELFLGDYMTTENSEEIKAIAIPNESLKELEGLYVASTFNRTLRLSLSDDGLMLGGRTQLIPVAPNTFRLKGQEGQITIEKGTEGETLLTLTDNAKNVFTKVEVWEPNEMDLSSFEGDYWSDELETVYHVGVKDKKLQINHRWLKDIALRPVSQDFFNTDFGIQVKFNRNDAGEITGLSVYSGRTLNVIFQRR